MHGELFTLTSETTLIIIMCWNYYGNVLFVEIEIQIFLLILYTLLVKVNFLSFADFEYIVQNCIS